MESTQLKSLTCLAQELPIQCVSSNLLPVNCLDKIKRALILCCKQLGYENVRYSYWLKNLVPSSETINAFSVNFSNFPSHWENLYNREHMYLTDPIVRIIQEKMGSQRLIHGSWGDAYLWAVQNPLGQTETQRQEYIYKINQLITKARQHDLSSGYYYSWGDSIRHIVVSLATGKHKSDDMPTLDIHTLHSMIVLVNQAIMDTQGCASCNKPLRIDGSNQIRLSKTEIYILGLYNQHKNACQKQIAEQCGRTIDTVNHHLRSIRQKLKMSGASGHALAAYASELNLL